MENNSAGEKVKKERKDKISFKNYVYTHFSVCSFAHLLKLPPRDKKGKLCAKLCLALSMPVVGLPV